MPTCWAASLGGCGGGFSGEHLVSAGIWEGAPIDVIGFSWCRDQPKSIGSASLVANILCRNHNTALSELDAEAKRAFTVFRDIVNLGDNRSALGSKAWEVTKFIIDGILLERWFIKTAISLCYAADPSITWLDGGSQLTDPPRTLTRAVFGEALLEAPTGLYAATSSLEQIHFHEGVQFAPIFYEGGLAAGLFNFYGPRFLLNFTRHSLPSELELPLGLGRHAATTTLLYHLAQIDFIVHGHLSHTLLLFPRRA